MKIRLENDEYDIKVKALQAQIENWWDTYYEQLQEEKGTLKIKDLIDLELNWEKYKNVIVLGEIQRDIELSLAKERMEAVRVV